MKTSLFRFARRQCKRGLLPLLFALLPCVVFAGGRPPSGCYDTSCNASYYALPPPPGMNAVAIERPAVNDRRLINAAPRTVTPSSPSLDNGGVIDGFYECDVTLADKTQRQILAINGKSNGQSVYTVASLSQSVPPLVVGFGLGRLTSRGYEGQTWNGHAFLFTPLGLADVGNTGTYNVLRIKGTVGVATHQSASLVCRTDNSLL